MKVSTRGRYALRLMIDLAQHNDDSYISLKEISARQDITVRYLEQIIAILLKAGFVQSFRGKSGGYRLSRHPREYTTEDILKLTEGSCPFPARLPRTAVPAGVKLRHAAFLAGAAKVVRDYLGRVTLEDLSEAAEGNRLRLRSRHLRSTRPEHFSTPFCFGLMSHFFYPA